MIVGDKVGRRTETADEQRTVSSGEPVCLEKYKIITNIKMLFLHKNLDLS